MSANTEFDVNNGSTDLTSPNTYTSGGVTPATPTTTSDVTFVNAAYAPPGPFTINGGATLSIGTLDDLSPTAITIQNSTAATTSTLTLNGGVNSVAPAQGGIASDLLFVRTGSTLTVTGATAPGQLLGLNLASSGNFDVVGTANINTIITGPGGFTKTGAGTLNLNAAVTATATAASGSTSLTLTNASSLFSVGQAISGTGIAANSVITAISGTAVTLSALTTGAVNGSVTISGNTYSGNTILNTGATTINQSAGIVSGVLRSGAFGTGTLTVNGGTLNGNSNIANNMVFGGDFTVGSVGRLGLQGQTLDLSGGTRTLSLTRTNVASALTTAGNANVLLSNGTFTVGVQNGTLRFVADTTAVPAGNVAIVQFAGTSVNFTGNSGLTIGNGVLTNLTSNPFGTSSSTTLPAVTVEVGGFLNGTNFGGTGSAVNVFSLSGAGTVTNINTAAGFSVLTITGTATATFSGNIVDGSSLQSTFSGVTRLGNVSLTKTGAGTQILSGANAFSGPTTVSGGALIVNGTNAAATNGVAGAVTVSGTGTLLGGNGSVAGATTVNGAAAGGNSKISPGATGGTSIGTFTINNTLALNGTYQVDINAAAGIPQAAGINFDQLTTTGALTLGSANSLLTFGSVNSTNLAQNQVFLIAQNGGAGAPGFFSNATSSGSTITDPNGDVFTVNYAAGDGNDIALTVQSVAPVPEPATVLGGCLLLGLAGWRERRRLAKGWSALMA